MTMRCPGSAGFRKKCGSTNIRVETRNANRSHFSAGRYAKSDYSRIRCLDCGWHWRSKAAGVASLPDLTEEEWLKSKFMTDRVL